MKDLYFYHDANGSFVDYSTDARDFLRDEFTITFSNITDSFYCGLYKPFNKLFLELKTPETFDVGIIAEYHDGFAWQPLELIDNSKGFQRSGFLSWEKPSNWNKNIINSNELFYIRLKTNNDFTATIQGFNLVFADDNDLGQDVRCINDYLQGNDISFIAYHVSARNEIVQTLRNGGKSTKKLNSVNYENLTHWDLLDIGEIRQAAKYLCLSKIFDDASENIDDKQFQRARGFDQNFGEAFKLYRLSIDSNDDGIADASEKTKLRRIKVTKL